MTSRKALFSLFCGSASYSTVLVLTFGGLLVTSCASRPGAASSSGSAAAPAPPPAPWSGESIRSTDVPSIYMTVWRSAANRDQCALLAPAQLPAEFTDAAPRAATFSGGWAVAYDTPQQRSAFGIAGTGTSAWSPGIYDQWPHRITWADSSRAGYGLEGGTGPNWLAYLRIPGQDCLYNVWSAGLMKWSFVFWVGAVGAVAALAGVLR
jgi:hypothetical protein